MRLLDFASVKLCGFLIPGILIGFYFEVSVAHSILILGTLLLALVFTYFKQTRHGFPFFGVIAMLSTIGLGILITSLSQPKNWSTHYSRIIQAAPQTYTLKITEVLKPTAHSHRYFAKAITVDDVPVSGNLLLSQPLDSINENTLFVDDELLVYAKPLPINRPLNPHQFDYRNYLKKQGVYHQIKLQQGNFYKQKSHFVTIFGLANKLRENIGVRLAQEEFGKEELSIIQALLLGKRNDISEETYNDYKNAGAVHILAISGLHIGILLVLLQFLLKPLEQFPKGKTLKLVIVVIALWSYALLAGLAPSVVRAVTMFSFLGYAMHLNRPVNMFNVLALSLFFILLVKPLFLFQVGLQMSYVAVFAILWIYPKLQRFWSPENILLKKAWQLLGVSFAAQLGVLPISLFYFHQFPALFFVSNLVVVPFLGIILGMGILVILLSLFNSLPHFLVFLYDFIIGKMNDIIGWVAKQEAFVFKDISFDAIQLILGYLVIFAIISTLSKPKFKNIALLLGGVVFLQFWGIFNQMSRNEKEELVVAHQIKNTILLHQKNGKLNVLGSKNKSTARLVKAYSIAEGIDTTTYDAFLENSYLVNQKKLHVMDSTAIYPSTMNLDYLLLTQSPKINLERFLDSVQTSLVLVDGSNFKSRINLWKKTCKNKKIPFHYTGEKGAYYFKLKPN